MSSAKEHMIKIIQQQPDDSSYDEILRELFFASTIDRGLNDPRCNRKISNEELKCRIKTWQK